MAAAEKKKSNIKGLGRGLDALLGDAPAARPASGKGGDDAGAPVAPAGPKRELPIEQLKPNADQPRRIRDRIVENLVGEEDQRDFDDRKQNQKEGKGDQSEFDRR